MITTRKNIALLLAMLTAGFAQAQSPVTVNSWLTDPSALVFFGKETQKKVFQKTPTSGNIVIRIEEKKRYQSIDGFGYALTGGSAMLMMKMSQAARTALIKEIFATDGENIGTSYLRISIGASDLDELVFSYDDVPKGATGLRQKIPDPCTEGDSKGRSKDQNNGITLEPTGMDENQ
jgi:glucosylceramidase